MNQWMRALPFMIALNGLLPASNGRHESLERAVWNIGFK